MTGTRYMLENLGIEVNDKEAPPMTDARLKLCPMCRGPATAGEMRAGEDGYSYVECKSCNRRGDGMGEPDVFFGVHADTPEMAAAAWNALPRADRAMPPADVVTRLRDAFFNGMRRYDARIECNQIEVRADALEAFVAWVDQQGEGSDRRCNPWEHDWSPAPHNQCRKCGATPPVAEGAT